MHPITPSAASCTQRFAREIDCQGPLCLHAAMGQGRGSGWAMDMGTLARVVTVQHAASSLSSSSLSSTVLQLP